MKERTSQILESIVREFSTSGEPVSSERLFDNYDFGVKPATIRAEMNELTQLGFLEQPHHSAGRVPSNKGYEFYVSAIWNRVEPDIPDPELASLFRNGAIPELLEILSDAWNVLGVASEHYAQTIYKEGLDNLFEGLHFESNADVRQIIRDFEILDERLPKLEEDFEKDFLEVFVGGKSPVTKSDELSVIMGDYFMNGERTILLAIGPKYMDYEKPLQIFKGFKKLMK